MNFIVNIFVCILILVVGFSTAGFPNEDLSVGYNEKLQHNNIFWEAFEEVSIYNIDLREMKLKYWDDEYEEFYEEGIDSEVLEDIAEHMYLQFTQHLKDILPVNDGKIEEGNKRALIIDLKLTGEFDKQDRGVIALFLIPDEKLDLQSTELKIQCDLTDSQSGKKIVHLTDSHTFRTTNRRAPFTSDEDFLQLTQLVDIWAKRLANYISQKRPQN